MKNLFLLCAVCFALFTQAQYSPQPFNVSGPATFNMSYSSGQYHYKRTTLDTVYADGHELLVIDDSTNTTTVTVHFPALTASNGATILPYPGEFFSIMSMDSIATLTLVSGSTIQNNVTTLGAGRQVGWVYTYSARSKAYVWCGVSSIGPVFTNLNNYVLYSDTTATIGTKKNLLAKVAYADTTATIATQKQVQSPTPVLDSTYAGFAHQTFVVRNVYIITAAGTISADTLTFPTGTNGDYIDVVFNRAVTTVSYGATSSGTGQCNFVAATAGQAKRFRYLNGFWY